MGIPMARTKGYLECIALTDSPDKTEGLSVDGHIGSRKRLNFMGIFSGLKNINKQIWIGIFLFMLNF